MWKATNTSESVWGTFTPPEPVDERCPVCGLVICGGDPKAPRCTPTSPEAPAEGGVQ